MNFPFTEEEQRRRHYQIYGTQQLVSGPDLTVGPQELVIDWGTVFAGFIGGVVFSFFVFTATGRKIGYRAGERVAKRV